MNETGTLIVDATDRIFRELAAPQDIIAASDDEWKQSLWTALEDSGLTLAWAPEGAGGAAPDIQAGFDILRTAGRHAVAAPLAETLLAGWLLAKAGLRAPCGPMTVAVGAATEPLRLDDGKLHGRARGVCFAGSVRRVVCVADGAAGRQVAVADMRDVQVDDAPGMSGDGVGAVDFGGAPAMDAAVVPNALGSEDLMLMGAAARAQQMAGALQAVLDLSVGYAREREAFGRPIAKFQAVQQNLARLAGETAAAAAAAESAADALHHAAAFDEAVFLEVAAAKIRTGEAAAAGASIAHQVHGAIGFTDEHALHRYTRRLFAWRDDFGAEAEWAATLGAMIAAKGADQLWPMVASR